MDYYYLIIVVILFLLALSGIIVGVSNDAVNFLNSAIGSKAAPFKVIMIVASLGIIIGATFSSGMMEVARSGIFHPEMFVFKDLMIVFLAVMIMNVLLLDLFNTFGLPTSTTVSLVFGLLGAAVGVSLIKISRSIDYTILDLSQFINTSKALAIVFSILASVIIGFIFGALIQYIARFIFTFRLDKTLKYFGGIWGGICVSLITYFLVFKGMKGSSLIPADTFAYLQEKQGMLLLGVFAVSTLLLQTAYWLFKFNALRFVVLLGTFALAMAFAGNDLVNFIGVPIAGLNSFEAFTAAGGADPNSFSMAFLRGNESNTQQFILIISGVVMVFTLWLSKKAQSVIKTTVDLSRQDSGTERFNSTPLSRSVVKMFMGVNEGINKITPKKWRKRVSKRFRIPKKVAQQDIAFDMLRASVNLMVASALIAFGTSLQLPLSTTYITFMAAMGTSLSDGAWGRESAVYRITGVFTVIGGWFITALAAFTLALILALLLFFGGYIALIIISIGVIYAMIHSQKLHKRREATVNKAEKSFIIKRDNVGNIHQITAEALCTSLERLRDIYENTINALKTEDLKTLNAIRQDMEDMGAQTKLMKDNLNETFKLFNEQEIENFHFYVQAVNYLREISNSTNFLVETSFTHTNNKHKPLIAEQLNELDDLSVQLKAFYNMIIEQISQEDYDQIEHSLGTENELICHIDLLNKKQMKRVKNGYSGTKNALLYSSILNNTRNLLLFSTLLLKAQRDFALNQN